jgi:hypothetical protein
MRVWCSSCDSAVREGRAANSGIAVDTGLVHLHNPQACAFVQVHTTSPCVAPGRVTCMFYRDRTLQREHYGRHALPRSLCVLLAGVFPVGRGLEQCDQHQMRWPLQGKSVCGGGGGGGQG